ncbi:MAG: hypothetical protein HZB46_07750 [Solirubrobacterales bacterium]|nr:hypothetical protein [Solirubrobacterales bacterium]
MPPADALARPASTEEDALGAWDDLPVHQSPALLGSVSPAQPGWAERFYFNVLAPTGEILAIMGGGVYPLRGVSECYFCRLDGDRQVNVRGFDELPAPGRDVAAGAFSIRCEVPLRDWRVAVDAGETRFDGRFAGVNAPYAYHVVDVPATEPDGGFDHFRHFIAVGRWDLRETGGLDAADGLLGIRDRTWGVRTRRVRWHNWCVFQVAGATITLIHQELADGTVMHSEAGVVHPDGRVDRLAVTRHDIRFDPADRQVIHGRWELHGDAGELTLGYERVGTALRLAGAGYDDRQGDRAAGGIQRDVYDLADPEVTRRTGRGTMDAGARVRAEGLVEGEGIGVVESAVARNHVRYGPQLG